MGIKRLPSSFEQHVVLSQNMSTIISPSLTSSIGSVSLSEMMYNKMFTLGYLIEARVTGRPAQSGFSGEQVIHSRKIFLGVKPMCIP